MGDITAILRNVSGPQNVDQETCAETIRGKEIIGNSADVKYWAEECIELNPPFEVKSGAAFLADFKPYGKESYYWTVKDHLSAVRVILDDDGDVVHSQDYYAFGLRWDYNDSPAYDKNRVGVIEQTGVAQSLDLMDYRLFDRTTGRFLSVDPLASEMPEWSPYNYTFNNPIRFTDPDGRSPDDIILRGSNNSSITIKTDLVDIDVNAGGIVGDLGGNYTFEGDDIIVAGLDIAGVVDPTGVADVAAAGIEAKNGNYGMAALSALGVIPYVGDVAKVGKIGKHTKTIYNAISNAKQAFKNAESASPALKGNPFSPGAVSKRQSQTRRDMGLNPDPKTTIPDQPLKTRGTYFVRKKSS